MMEKQAMEEFAYLDWAQSHPLEGLIYEREDEDHLLLHTDDFEGAVNIYHLDGDVAELQLTRKKDGQNCFFLHFELKDEKHAKELYQEMLESLGKQMRDTPLEVLLSCTSGLTTSFFAEKLNEAARTLSLNYSFSAVAYSQLYDHAFDCDVILLAPQIGYTEAKVKEILPDRPVITIPARMFGSYDAAGVINYIRDETEKRSQTIRHMHEEKELRQIEDNSRILVLNLTHDIHHYLYTYRIYDEGKPVFTETVVKEKHDPGDIFDILDTQLMIQKKVDIVSISLPGILTSQNEMGFERFNYEGLAGRLSDRYHVPFFVSNNTNAVALGWYAQQDKYQNVTYHSQPRGGLIGGQGIVIDGKPLQGRSNISGELNYIYRGLIAAKPDDAAGCDPEKAKKIIAKMLIANIAMVDPDIILVRSDLTPDMDELTEEIAKTIEPEHIPELVYLRDVSEYALLGTMLMGVTALKEKRKGT